VEAAIGYTCAHPDIRRSSAPMAILRAQSSSATFPICRFCAGVKNARSVRSLRFQASAQQRSGAGVRETLSSILGQTAVASVALCRLDDEFRLKS